MKVFEDKKEKEFLLVTSFLSVLIGVLYIWKGVQENFYAGTYAVIAMTCLYVPVVWIFRRLGFAVYNLIYSVFMTFIIAINDTYLYNNYTALLAIFLSIIILPKIKWYALILYFLGASIAFAINEENLCHYFIHIARSIWLFYIMNHLIKTKYERRKLSLYDDERKILEALSKNRLQKSIELDGFSESTIYRRIKAAMKRNNLTKKQLIEEFIKEQNEN